MMFYCLYKYNKNINFYLLKYFYIKKELIIYYIDIIYYISLYFSTLNIFYLNIIKIYEVSSLYLIIEKSLKIINYFNINYFFYFIRILVSVNHVMRFKIEYTTINKLTLQLFVNDLYINFLLNKNKITIEKIKKKFFYIYVINIYYYIIKYLIDTHIKISIICQEKHIQFNNQKGLRVFVYNNKVIDVGLLEKIMLDLNHYNDDDIKNELYDIYKNYGSYYYTSKNNNDIFF